MARRYWVEEGNRFAVTKDDRKANVFRASANGLDAKAAADKYATVLVNTVKGKKTMSNNAEVSKAEYARALQRKLGHVSKAEFIWIVTSTLLPNCPVTGRNIVAAEDIYGPDLGSGKG